MSQAVLWKRLDFPGHDACCLLEHPASWSLEGSAVFREGGAVSLLRYQVACDRAWCTREGQVRGWSGGRRVELDILRTAAGTWTLNGSEVPEVEGCFDLDLGFTPATNLLQLRRVALAVGQTAEVPVAWIDAPGERLELVRQTYERRSASTYWYESPRFGYAALLELGPDGFVQRYPALWEAET